MPSSSKKRKRKSLLALSPEVLCCQVILKSKTGHKILKMAVDTGANFTLIPAHLALDLGLKLVPPDDKEVIVTANGVIYAPTAEIPLLGALGIELHGFKVLCYDLHSQSRVDGILGLDFLSYFPPYQIFREEVLKISPQFWKS